MDFIEKKQKKERGYSVKDVLKDANKSQGDYEDAVFIGITSEGGLDFGYSVESDAKLIGILEVLKAELIDNIREQ